ncbi:sensor histidine kinase [Actinoplanes sp. NPDC049265]|uniref:sensor histidine kinase n=1 Tax=Actinoplanes sp. NPDC049265 TaxID=3363902 RepID=UPI00371BAEB8
MLSRLTLRWRLTLMHTGVFVAVGAVVVTMVFIQNRIVIARVGRLTEEDLTGVVHVGKTNPGGGPPISLLDQISLQRDDAIGTILAQWIAALAVMTVIVGLLAWSVTGRVLGRVHAMTAQARHISVANLHERIAVHGPADEIRELSDTFNDLLTRIDDAFSAQARFIANASHELRTPLAVARTTLQIGLATTEPGRVRRVRDELLRNNERCTALINGLLTLARGEQGRPEQEMVELDDVVRRAAVEATTDLRPGSPRLELEVSGRCTVIGDRLLLAQLVRNLVDNALHYNVPGGEVLVRLTPDGHLTVSNTGPRIGSDEATRLFEPFYRGARRTGRTDGAGLGLSIVRAVAAACRGTATATPRSGGGLIVEVSIPPLTLDELAVATTVRSGSYS